MNISNTSEITTHSVPQRNKSTSRIHLIEASHTLSETHDTIELEALWQDNNPNNEAVDTVALLCHPNPLHGGTMTNKVVTTMWRFARDNNCHVVRFNFRGVGQSTGEHDYGNGEIIDALNVLQWIQNNSNAEKLWLGGFSFGGYVAARVAEQISFYSHVWGLDFELSNLALIAPSVVNNDTADLSLPTAITFQVHGDADEVVCPAAMYDFAKRMNIKQTVLSEVGHFFHGNLSTLKKALEEHTTM